MEYSHRYHASPTQEVAVELERHIDIHHQAYNYTRYEYTHFREKGDNIFKTGKANPRDHREIPDGPSIKEVTVKKETSGRRRRRRARELIEVVDESKRLCVHLAGVVAGALYQAGRETSERVTQEEFARAAEVSEATIRVCYQEFA